MSVSCVDVKQIRVYTAQGAALFNADAVYGVGDVTSL